MKAITIRQAGETANSLSATFPCLSRNAASFAYACALPRLTRRTGAR
jgi:hypothetical protein